MHVTQLQVHHDWIHLLQARNLSTVAEVLQHNATDLVELLDIGYAAAEQLLQDISLQAAPGFVSVSTSPLLLMHVLVCVLQSLLLLCRQGSCIGRSRTHTSPPCSQAYKCVVHLIPHMSACLHAAARMSPMPTGCVACLPGV